MSYEARMLFDLVLEGLLTPLPLLLGGLILIQYCKTKLLSSRSPLKVADLRRADRVKTHAVIELGDALGQCDAAARVVDLSLNGVCFASPLVLRTGDAVEGKIQSSPDWLLKISGQIVWMKPAPDRNLYGLQIQTAVHTRAYTSPPLSPRN